MVERTSERPEHTAPARGSASIAYWLSAGLYLVAYLATELLIASRSSLWLDEVLTTWAARLPGPAAIYSAVAHGSEFSPPTFPLLLHYLIKITGGSDLALRLPSIFAILLAVACSFSLMRRYLGWERAAFGAALALEDLRFYALQARPYALVCACMALALVLWDGLGRMPDRISERGPTWWRNAAIALLLAFAISLHFYAVLLVPCLGLIELLYAWRTGRLRWGLWIALVCAGASILVWAPLMHQMSHYVSMDANSPAYYARPTLDRLLSVYDALFLRGSLTPLLLFAALGVSALALLQGIEGEEAPSRSTGPERTGFGAMLIGLAAFPLIVFIFSRVVTRTFNERYAMAAELGISAIIAAGIRATPVFRRVTPLLLVLAAALTAAHLTKVERTVDVVAGLPGEYPVVVASAKSYFELLEVATPEERKRMIYLTAPPEVVLPDPTNEHLVERWKTIKPELRVETVERFLSDNDRFYLIDGPEGDGVSAQLLLARHRIALLKSGGSGGMQLYESRPAQSR